MNANKQPITLRTKSLSGGRKSLYLDYYDYSTRDKAKSHRYEFLKLYLLPETSRENKAQNREIMRSAQAILNQRLIDRANGMAHIKTQSSAKILLSDWMERYAEIKRTYGQSDANATIVQSCIKKLDAYRPNVMLCQVDKNFCLGFVSFLTSAPNSNASRNQKTISKRTAKIYFTTLSSALTQAVRQELITQNPANLLTREEKRMLAFDEEQRTYLTPEELSKLVATPCHREDVKNAFLFACFCGLRLSDINTLQWNEIHFEQNGKVYIYKQMKKTAKYITLPISRNALSFLPEIGVGNVFHLGNVRNVNVTLKKWAKKSGIQKDICFHVSRHTFATSLLTQGADIYTTSKLLGHRKIQTTQIYAEIVNQKKVEAVNLLDNIKL